MMGVVPTVRQFLAEDPPERRTKGTSDKWSKASLAKEQGTRMGEDMVAKTGKEYGNVQEVSNKRGMRKMIEEAIKLNL